MKTDLQKSFNPWPYSILGVFAVAVVAAVGWVGFCIGHGSDLVADDYYEQEVEYQKHMDRIEHGQALGEGVSIAYEPALGFIRIRLPQAQARLRPTGAVHLYRPSEAGLDRTLPLELDGAGEQHVDAGLLKPGQWEVRVRWSAAGEEFFRNEKVRVGTGAL
ncbi:MAG: FixH family protein [Verrucomicrobia bacterium]|nr:FixH family protein [Verrucomicrobiota bacterium]